MNLLACAHAAVILKTEDTRAWWACRECNAPFAPVERPATTAPVDHGGEPEYLSVRQLASRIPYAEGQIRNMMSSGVFLLGTHYDKPQGRVMFRWAAVRAWIEGERRAG